MSTPAARRRGCTTLAVFPAGLAAGVWAFERIRELDAISSGFGRLKPSRSLKARLPCDVLPTLPAESVHCCVSSPPYWGLRDYGTGTWTGGNPACDHLPPTARRGTERRASTLGGGVAHLTAQEGGSFGKRECPRCLAGSALTVSSGARRRPRKNDVRNMVDDVFAEVRRVLRDDGTLWLNIGDSYSMTTRGSSGRGKNGTNRGSVIEDRSWQLGPSCKPKDLVGIPWRVAATERCRAGWLVSAPGHHLAQAEPDARERYRPLYQEPRIYFSAQQVGAVLFRQLKGDSGAKRPVADGGAVFRQGLSTMRDRNDGDRERDMTPTVDRNRRSVWTVGTKPYKEAHFATFPPDLILPCILAGTSAEGCCARCGAPWEKQINRERMATRPARDSKLDGHAPEEFGNRDPERHVTTRTVTGWQPTCRCGDKRKVPATVLDPFAGSGTTALVAQLNGCRSIGIELNPKYCKLARRRTQQATFLGA